MSLIPTWLFAVIGSPLQELINSKVPERFRPLSLWGVAALILVAAILITPLGGSDFIIQLPLVYAALTSGWAMSRVVARPSGDAVRRGVPLLLLLAGGALAASAWAQADSTGFYPEESTPQAVSPVATIATFMWTQLAAFIGSVLTRWLSPARRG